MFRAVLQWLVSGCSRTRYEPTTSVVALAEDRAKAHRRIAEATEALMAAEDRLGPDHPETADRLTDLASAYVGDRQYDEAEGLFRRAMALREAALGPNDPEIARTLEELGWLNFMRSDHPAAESIYLQALELRERIGGPEPPDTPRLLAHLGGVVRAQRRIDEAIGYYDRCLTRYGETVDSEDVYAATIVEILSQLHRETGRTHEADGYARRAAEIRRKIAAAG